MLPRLTRGRVEFGTRGWPGWRAGLSLLVLSLGDARSLSTGSGPVRN